MCIVLRKTRWIYVHTGVNMRGCGNVELGEAIRFCIQEGDLTIFCTTLVEKKTFGFLLVGNQPKIQTII